MKVVITCDKPIVDELVRMAENEGMFDKTRTGKLLNQLGDSLLEMCQPFWFVLILKDSEIEKFPVPIGRLIAQAATREKAKEKVNEFSRNWVGCFLDSVVYGPFDFEFEAEERAVKDL